MQIWQAILLGIVQGITEFLPVSSSGHLVLAQHFLGFQEPQLLFDIAVHFATLFAVAVFFFPVILKLRFKEWLVLAVGTIPAVVIGLVFKDAIEGLFAAEMLVAGALMITGVINIGSDKMLEKQQPKVGSVAEVGWISALVIGLFQAFAITPGISRSGSTLFAGLTQKLDRQTAFTFSFLLSLPAVAGATLLQVLDIVELGTLSLPIPVLVIGGLTAFISGYASLWLFKRIVSNARMEIFGWYCLVLGASSLIFFFFS